MTAETDRGAASAATGKVRHMQEKPFCKPKKPIDFGFFLIETVFFREVSLPKGHMAPAGALEMPQGQSPATLGSVTLGYFGIRARQASYQ